MQGERGQTDRQKTSRQRRVQTAGRDLQIDWGGRQTDWVFRDSRQDGQTGKGIQGQQARQTGRGIQGQQTGQTGVFRDSRQGRTEKGTGRRTDRGIQTLSRKENRDEQKEDEEGAACT